LGAGSGGTRLTLRHAGVPDDDFGRQHRAGWTWILGALETRFAGRAGECAAKSAASAAP
jgi:hypothetical protein